MEIISPEGKTITSYILPYAYPGWIRTMKVKDDFLHIVFTTPYQGDGYAGSALAHVIKAEVMTGQIAWQLTLPGFMRIFADTDSQGNVYVGGDRFVNPLPSQEFVMAKYDAAGDSL